MLRKLSVRALKEMVEGKNLHRDVLATMVGALVKAMQDFSDVEIAYLLGKMLRDEEATFNTIRELILDNFKRIVDSAFINDDLISSLERMLGRDIKSHLVGVAKDTAKEIILGFLEKQIGQAGTKAAASVTQKVYIEAQRASNKVGGFWPFGWCSAEPAKMNAVEDEMEEQARPAVWCGMLTSGGA